MLTARRIQLFICSLCSLFAFITSQVNANPYLAKPGERRFACASRLARLPAAVSGIFTRPWKTIFSRKYRFKLEHVYIRSSGPSLAALMADEVQFLYCAADATIPALVGGIDAKIVAARLVKMPFVLVTQEEIRRLEDLKGQALGVVRPGNISERLSKAVVRKFNIPESEVTIRPVGGSQAERFQAMRMNMVQAIVVTPPLDARAKNEGFNVLY